MTTTADLTPHQLNHDWQRAFNAGDLERLMTMYEPDAVLVPGPGADPVVGLQAIEASLTWFLGLGGTLEFVPRHWLVNGDIAMASIAFEMHDGRDESGQPVVLTGVTAEVARRQSDGSWKYVIDHPFGGA